MFEIEELFKVLLTTSMSFLVILVFARLLGKKQMSQLTFFNYITGITIGSIAANIVTLEGKDFWLEISTLAWWCLLTFVVDYIVLKIPKLRVIIDGQPTILIKKGKIEYQSLKNTRMNMDDLMMLLREEGIFTITEVEFAILEPNGELTVLKKVQYQTPTSKDLLVKSKAIKYLPQELIVSGNLRKKNLKEAGLEQQWLMEQLKKRGIHDIKKVKYAELLEDGQVFIDI